MSHPLARLHLDHNISWHLVSPLQVVGHEVSVARDLGLTRLTDDAQLLSAVRASRVLVTHDRGDFILLYDAWLTWPAAFGIALPPHPGILVLDPAPHRTLFGILDAFLTAIGPTPLTNELFWWHRGGNWRRRVVGTGWEP